MLDVHHNASPSAYAIEDAGEMDGLSLSMIAKVALYEAFCLTHLYNETLEELPFGQTRRAPIIPELGMELFKKETALAYRIWCLADLESRDASFDSMETTTHDLSGLDVGLS
jgi:hypothetical protein